MGQWARIQALGSGAYTYFDNNPLALLLLFQADTDEKVTQQCEILHIHRIVLHHAPYSIFSMVALKVDA